MESFQIRIAEMSNAIEAIPQADIQSLTKLFEELESLVEWISKYLHLRPTIRSNRTVRTRVIGSRGPQVEFLNLDILGLQNIWRW